MAATKVYGCFVLLSLLMIICSADNTNRYAFADPIGSYCYKNPKCNTTIDLTDNVNKAISDLVKIMRYSSYGNVTEGEDTDYTIYGLAQCRRDISPNECNQCMKLAAKAIKKNCQYSPDARVWYDRCFMRYDTEDFVQQMDVGIYVHHQTPQLIPSTVTNFSDTRYNVFMQDLFPLLMKPQNRGFATASRQIDNTNTIYALCQCTQDIDPDECCLCMNAALESFPQYCGEHHGCVIASSSCYVKYDLYPFISNTRDKVATRN